MKLQDIKKRFYRKKFRKNLILKPIIINKLASSGWCLVSMTAEIDLLSLHPPRPTLLIDKTLSDVVPEKTPFALNCT